MASEFTVGTQDLWAEKDKDAVRDYTFKLSGVLAGSALSAVSWAIAPAAAGGAEVVSSSFTADTATVRLRGGAQRQWYVATCSWEAASGVSDDFALKLFIKEDADASLVMGSALFPNKFTAIAKMRQDRLMMLAGSLLPDIQVSDEYLWDKLLAAEAEIGHELRVPLQPTRFFPTDPTQEQIDELGGMPWALDPAYDYEPEAFTGAKWGFIIARNKPLIRVLSMVLVYPTQTNVVLTVPDDWIRMDKRYGQINLVPSGAVSYTGFATSLLGAMTGHTRLPFSLRIDYIAGLENVSRDFPDLIDVVMKTAALKILQDAFLPQSGSISADGLSQSMSVDSSKYRETIDLALNGPPGSNGGLMAKIHGIRVMVM